MRYEIGSRIRKYREQIGLSQKEFARLIGVSNARVSNWEQGLNRPDVDVLADICSTLKVDPNVLLDIQPGGEQFSDEEKLLIRQYRKKPGLQHSVKILLGIDKSE